MHVSNKHSKQLPTMALEHSIISNAVHHIY